MSSITSNLSTFKLINSVPQRIQCNRDQIELLTDKVMMLEARIESLAAQFDDRIDAQNASLIRSVTLPDAKEQEEAEATPWDGSGSPEWVLNYDDNVDSHMADMSDGATYCYGVFGDIYCVVRETEQDGVVTVQYLPPLSVDHVPEERKCLKLDGVLRGIEFANFNAINEGIPAGDTIFLFVSSDHEKPKNVHIFHEKVVYCGGMVALDVKLLTKFRVCIPGTNLSKAYNSFKALDLEFVEVGTHSNAIARHYETDFTPFLKMAGSNELRAVLILVLMDAMMCFPDPTEVLSSLAYPRYDLAMNGQCGLCTVKEACSIVEKNVHWGLSAHSLMYATGQNKQGAASDGSTAMHNKYGRSTGMKLSTDEEEKS